MGTNHLRTDILVAKQLLYRPNIVTIFQQMRSEGMAKCMTPGPFDDISFEDSCLNSSMEKGLLDVLSVGIHWPPWHTL
jgi:hypothetical protein